MKIQLVALVSLMMPAQAADWFVDAAASCAAGDGSSARPFCSISEALSVAAAGDQVLVRPGTYIEGLSLTRDVRVVGLDGSSATTIDAARAGRVVDISVATVVLEGLTITGGSANTGAGVRFAGGSLEMRACRVTDNWAVESTTTPAGGLGAGVAVFGGDVLLDRVLIDQNRADSGVGSAGFGACGALLVNHARSLTMLNTEVAGNSAWYHGAGSLADVGSVSIVGSTFQDNHTGSACDPTLQIVGCSGRVENCTVASQTGYGEGLLVFVPDGQSIEVEHGTFHETCTNALIVRRPSGGSGTVRVSSSIFTGWSGPFTQQDGALVSGGHNVIEPAMDPSHGFVDGVGGDQVGVGPMGLGPLTNQGGATSTMALDASSPARGAGDPLSSVATDQRGVPRPGAVRDSGAFESTRGDAVSICVVLPNSTGSTGGLVISGDPSVAAGALALTAHSLPAGAPTLFLASRLAQLALMPGGSQGNLCLGGAIGRFARAGEVGTTTDAGVRALSVDLLDLPQPTGASSGSAGETWYFQSWHRDTAGGVATSNFTEAAGLVLR